MKKVLIVEDNEKHMEALNKMLSDIEDVQIFKAYNMAEACYMLSLNYYSLFIVDIILDREKPGDVSGIKFVDQLRSDKKYQFIPVIFITSLEDPKLCAYRDLHCYQYIEKPFEPGYVIKTVKQALEFPNIVNKKEYGYFRKDGIVYSVKIDDITYVVVGRTGIEINTLEDRLTLGYQPIATLLKEFDRDEFVRCSRNTIVNINHIEYMDFARNYIKIKNLENELEMGPILKKQLRQKVEERGIGC